MIESQLTQRTGLSMSQAPPPRRQSHSTSRLTHHLQLTFHIWKPAPSLKTKEAIYDAGVVSPMVAKLTKAAGITPIFAPPIGFDMVTIKFLCF